MSDKNIVEDLRIMARVVDESQGEATVTMLSGSLFDEAADEIERLRAEIDSVKKMHHRFHNGDADNGATICYGCGKRWPCPTITAMEEARRG